MYESGEARVSLALRLKRRLFLVETRFFFKCEGCVKWSLTVSGGNFPEKLSLVFYTLHLVCRKERHFSSCRINDFARNASATKVQGVSMNVARRREMQEAKGKGFVYGQTRHVK